MLEKIFLFLSQLVKSVLSLLKVLIRSRFFLPKHPVRATEFYILGNGPSLNIALNQHRESLKSNVLLCVNGFSLTEHFEKLKPQYYIINAPEFWAQNTLVGETFEKERGTINNMTKSIVEKTSWDMVVYLPVQSKQNKSFIQYFKSNPHIALAFYNTTPVEGLKAISHILFSLWLGSPRPHNVLIPSILIGINSGVENIYLLGADHSWLPLLSVDDENRALVNHKHFYDEENSVNKQMHKYGKAPRRLHEILEKFVFSFRAYFELKDYAATKGVKIFNCTPGSFIDAFDRKDLESALSNSAIRK